MVTPISTQHRNSLPLPVKAIPPNPATELKDAGKSVESVGHRAKTAVDCGEDTAPNALGKAAAMIARTALDGLD